MTTPAAIEPFAGPGGWDLGAAAVGVDVLGVELDAAACATRAAAGLRTIRADVARWPEDRIARRRGFDGVIASPPCQTFSTAGKGAGRLLTGELIEAVRDAAAGRYASTIAAHRRSMAHRLRADWLASGYLHATRAETSALAWRAVRNATLVVEPARFVRAARPRWVALEQVPAVLPIWEALAEALADELGYACWVGVLNAADYGVPQVRRRAILLARADGVTPTPPEPTHADRAAPRTLFAPDLPDHVTMAEALGWGYRRRPSPPVMTARGGGPETGALDGGANMRAAMLRRMTDPEQWTVGFDRRYDGRAGGATPDGYRARDRRPVDRPAATVTEKARSLVLRTGANSMVTGRTPADVQPYERDLDRPAPTVATNARTGWRVNTGRDWKPGGDRDDAQTFDPTTEPARTIDGKGRWHLHTAAMSLPSDRSRPRDPELDPAPTVAFGHDADAWRWRRNDQSGAGETDPDWPLDRPATTVAGRDLVADPGANANRYNGAHKSRNDGYRVTLAEVSVLQTFPPDYPWQGTRTKQFEQVGNAVPPLLAAHVLATFYP